MALPTPPIPPETPPTNTTTTTTATTTRPSVYPRPPPHQIYPTHRPPSNPNPNYPQLAPRPDPSHLRYPLSSSGRGFVGRPTGRNSNTSPRRPFVFSYPDPNPFFIRPPQMRSGPPATLLPSGLARGGVHVSSTQLIKVGGTSAGYVLDGNANGHKQLRDRNRDDVSVIIRDRKVRVRDNASLYSHCRSWLRNGFPEEAQPQYLDTAKTLPKPLPLAVEAVNSPDKKEGDKEEGDEDEGSFEHLSTKELLQRHVRRAKRIRSRLREERLERITRYKARLALLLPPMVDQSPMKNETN